MRKGAGGGGGEFVYCVCVRIRVHVRIYVAIFVSVSFSMIPDSVSTPPSPPTHDTQSEARKTQLEATNVQRNLEETRLRGMVQQMSLEIETQAAHARNVQRSLYISLSRSLSLLFFLS